ncbi:MAG TPA: cytochrome c biogenesis heme-transporting ATPase CcmA [Burkholderiales bacterium]
MLEAIDLECRRGGRLLFRELSFTLGSGELLRIAGANGRGKTSLLRILCGLLQPVLGEVRWKGSPVLSLREEFSKDLVYIGHAPAVKDDLTAAENLSLALRIAGRRASDIEVHTALLELDVPVDALLKKLSQGQRRRAALARLLLSEAVPIWLLDEPFSALDSAATRAVEGLISAHVARGGAVVYTTHQESRLQARVVDLDA